MGSGVLCQRAVLECGLDEQLDAVVQFPATPRVVVILFGQCISVLRIS